jgi:putative peptidoglycan lipid II flippase
VPSDPGPAALPAADRVAPAAATPSATAGELERQKITGRASVVAAGTLASRLLGLGRDQVLAAMFSRAATDAFFVAFTIPNVLGSSWQRAPRLRSSGAGQGAEQRMTSQRLLSRGTWAPLMLAVVTALGVVCALTSICSPPAFAISPASANEPSRSRAGCFPHSSWHGRARRRRAQRSGRFVVTAFAPGC